MKSLVFVAPFLALLSPLSLRAESIPSQITAATVYTDRAIVTRTARLEVPQGETELTFEHLPASLLDRSLQVSGHGTATATILDVNARITFVAATPDSRVKSLEDQLAAQQKKLRVLADRAGVLDQQKALLSRIETAVTTPPNKDNSAPRPSFDDWQKLLNFAEENRGKLASEQQSLDPQREEVQAGIAALNEQLNALRGEVGTGGSFKTVTVRIAAASAGSLELALAYAVPGASWVPSYDARLRSEDRAIELTYFGVVRQNTGEDWKAVALTLSTARPGLGGSAPELRPWILDIAQPRFAARDVQVDELNVMKAKRSDARQVFNQAAPSAPSPEGAGAADVSFGVATAAVQSAATSASFKISSPATLLSDNSPQKVGIATAKLTTQLQYQATPREREVAFLSAYVTNTTDYPLLAGSVNTFLADAFVATSALRTVMPGEKFELALGADEGIAIKRKTVPRFSEETGLTNSGRRVTYEYLITVTNNKKTSEHIVFKEVLPVSRNEKIMVKPLEPAERDFGTPDKPKEVTREAEGKLVWRLDLKPNEKREIPFKFAVEYPGDVAVSGLE